MINGDYIRSLDNEKLAIIFSQQCGNCPSTIDKKAWDSRHKQCYSYAYDNKYRSRCINCWRDYLSQEVSE